MAKFNKFVAVLVMVICVLNNLKCSTVGSELVPSACLDNQGRATMEPILLVHGGAGDIEDSRKDGKYRGVKIAVKLGYAKLIETGSAVDAVEEAVRSLELDDYFNCGYGAVLTIDGTVETDAAIMDGRNMQAGCLGNLKNVLHPVSVARRVMEQTKHNLLVGAGIDHFAKEQGFEILRPGALVSPYAKKALEDYKERKQLNGRKTFGEPGTVGAVAIDCHGNIAAATSTGGLTGKLPGRVGDTPIIGAGTYADNLSAAISATGHGETIMRVTLAKDIVNRMQSLNRTAQEATEEALVAMTDRFNETAGAITIDKDGGIGIAFTSARMSWGYQKQDTLYYGIEKGEIHTEKV